MAGTDRTQLGSDPKQQETDRAWGWNIATRMAPVSSEGKPCGYSPEGWCAGPGGTERGRRLSGPPPPPPICSPQFLSFPLEGAGRTGSTSHHPPLTTEGWSSTWTSQKPGPTCVLLPSPLRNVTSLSGGLVVGFGLRTSLYLRVIVRPRVCLYKLVLVLRAVSALLASLSQADASYTLGIQRPYHC